MSVSCYNESLKHIDCSPLSSSNANNHSSITFNQLRHNNKNLQKSCTLLKNYYHLPGYTGKIPQESQMFGLTRSEMSRRVFRNSDIYTRPDTLFSPKIDPIDIETSKIRANLSIKDRILMPDITISGYTGHIPTMQEKFGKTIKNLFLESMSNFENDQKHQINMRLDFKWQQLLENKSITKQDLPRNSLVTHSKN